MMITNNTFNTIKPVFIAGTAILTIIAQPIGGQQHHIPQMYSEQIFHAAPLYYDQIDNSLVLTDLAEVFEPIIELPTTKRLKVKISRPALLTIQNVQDEEGMY